MIEIKNGQLTIGCFAAQELVDKFNSPLYVYDIEKLGTNIRIIRNAITHRPLSIHFACMANNNISLLKEVRRLGIGIFVCTSVELAIGRSAGFTNDQIVITGSNFNDTEAKAIAQPNITINVDSISQLIKFTIYGNSSEIRYGIRVTPDCSLPSGIMNKAVGPGSRLGILEEIIPNITDIARDHGIIFNGTHMYLGTNINNFKVFSDSFETLLNVSSKLSNLEYIDIGGGFGISRSTDDYFDWNAFGAMVDKGMKKLTSLIGKDVELKLEPGRAVVGTAGVLLTRVTELKRQNDHVFIGTDTSLSNFIRPYLYHQYHDIISVDQNKYGTIDNNVTICGNTVASEDIFAKQLAFPKVEEGDILAIMDVGAYGYSMSSHFCARLRPAEIMVKNGQTILIRKRETVDDLLQGQIIEQ